MHVNFIFGSFATSCVLGERAYFREGKTNNSKVNFDASPAPILAFLRQSVKIPSRFVQPVKLSSLFL